MVMFIPDPRDFDVNFRKESDISANERMKDFSFFEQDFVEYEQSTRTDLYRFIYNLPRYKREVLIRKCSPDISEEKLDEMEKAFQSLRRNDPLALDQPSDENDAQLTAMRMGLNLETTLYLSENIGAFPYTNLKVKWRELLSVRQELPEEAKLWSPLTQGFRELDFKFLDNVDSQFAYEMRDNGRLESFRAYLRRVWKTLNKQDNHSNIEIKAKEFREELFDEYRKAQSEWEQIDTDLIKWVGATISGGLVAGIFSLVPPALPAMSVVALSVFKLIESHRKRKEFSLKIPMSVFIDLTKHKPRK